MVHADRDHIGRPFDTGDPGAGTANTILLLIFISAPRP